MATFRDIWHAMGMVPTTKQVEFCERAIGGSLQGFFPRQAGSTTTIAVMVATLSQELKPIVWVAAPRLHEQIYDRLTRIFDALRWKWVLIRRNQGKEYEHHHMIRLIAGAHSTIYLLQNYQSEHSDAQLIVADQAQHYPIHRVQSRLDDGIRVLELGCGRWPRWDPVPVIMNWWESEIADQSVIKSLLQTSHSTFCRIL